jgi:hypothetical protein
MIKYEYDVVLIPLTEEQQNAVSLGIVEIGSLNEILKKILNTKADDGWEPLYPFTFPSIWFKRPIPKNKNAKI